MNACEKTCVYVWRGNRNLQKVQPSAGFGFSGWLKATPVAASDGDGLRTGSGRARAGTIGTDAHTFARFKLRGRRGILARSGTDFVAGASLSQGQVQILWQAQHFREVKHRFRGRRSTFARSTFAAGARKSQLLSAKVVSEVNFRSWGLKSTFAVGLENRNYSVRKERDREIER